MRMSDWSSDVCSSDLKDAAHDIALRIARTAPRIEGMHVYGPAPAPLAMLRGRHRFRLLVHAPRAPDVPDLIRHSPVGPLWNTTVPVPVSFVPHSFVLSLYSARLPLQTGDGGVQAKLR